MFPIPLGLSCTWDMPSLKKVPALLQQKQLLMDLTGHFRQWWILPAIRAGEGFQKDRAKIHTWERLRKQW